METIHLIGTEEVTRAGHNMNSAAESMRRAADQIDVSLYRFLERFEDLVARMEQATKPPEDCPGEE